MDDRIAASTEPPRISAVSCSSEIDVRLRVSDRQLPLTVDDEMASVLASLGRTEDLALSPDGALLVIAGFDSNRLCLVQVRIGPDGVEIGDVRAAGADGLARPHGLTFLDDTTLLVANRESQLSLVCLDEQRVVVQSSTVLIDGTADVPVRTPGSVAVRRLGGDLVEVFVCNNYAHDVTRYVLDARQDWSIIDQERLLAAGLDIPDGVAVSEGGSWIAVSNHNQHAVFLYRYDDQLSVDTSPHGVLRGVNYPHGLAFADGDRRLVVADAGLPNLHVFEAPDRDWSGVRIPARIDRVMEEEAFHRGRYNPQEGGPKGLEIVAGRFVALTGEFLPLAFFELGESGVPGAGEAPPGNAGDVHVRTPFLRLTDRARAIDAQLDRMESALLVASGERDDFAAELDACRAQGDELRRELDRGAQEAESMSSELDRVRRSHAEASVEIERLVARLADLERQVDEVYASRSWRLSAPLRVPSWILQRLRPARE